jgi:hypothetical protein
MKLALAVGDWAFCSRLRKGGCQQDNEDYNEDY